MQEATATKLNLPKETTFTLFPLAFTGKPKKDAEGNFIPNSNPFSVNGKGLPVTAQQILGVVHTADVVFGGKKTTYDYIAEKIGRCRDAVWRNLKILRDTKMLASLGQSRYKIEPVEGYKADHKNFLPIDDYLFTTEFKIKKRRNGVVEFVSKRLTRSAVEVLAFLIRHYNNPDNKNKKFISSENRIATALNIAPSTVSDALDELIGAGLVYRKLAIKNSSNELVFINGKGRNGYELSCYEVASALLRVVRKSKKKSEQPKAEPPKPIKERPARRARKRTQKVSAFSMWAETAERFKREEAAEELHKELQADPKYNELCTQIEDSCEAQRKAKYTYNNAVINRARERHIELQNLMEEYLFERDIRPQALYASKIGKKLWGDEEENIFDVLF